MEPPNEGQLKRSISKTKATVLNEDMREEVLGHSSKTKSSMIYGVVTDWNNSVNWKEARQYA